MVLKSELHKICIKKMNNKQINDFIRLMTLQKTPIKTMEKITEYINNIFEYIYLFFKYFCSILIFIFFALTLISFDRHVDKIEDTNIDCFIIFAHNLIYNLIMIQLWIIKFVTCIYDFFYDVLITD
jgi:hypothetical protein